jgi:RimJ/RimL family protein N-acetyltransferase
MLPEQFEHLKSAIMKLSKEDRHAFGAYLDDLQCRKFDYRRLTTADLGWLEPWFNDETLRARLGGVLPLKTWLEFASTTDTQTNRVATKNGVPVGVVIGEPLETGTSIALFVDPSARGQGVGREVLRGALLEHPTSQRFFADIEPDNAAAIACFQHCGFTKSEKAAEPEFLRFEYTPDPTEEPA